MGNPHILVLPYPAQSHVISLMELSHILTKHGFKISFVNTKFNHKRMLNAFGKEVDENGLLHLVSILDGLDDDDSRNQIGKLTESLSQVMPGKLKEFIEKVNTLEEEKITCAVADIAMGWALDVTAELGIRGVAYFPASVYCLAMILNIPKFIEDGVVDENGVIIYKHNMFQLSPSLPPVPLEAFPWIFLEDPVSQKFCFQYQKQHFTKGVDRAAMVVCNSSSVLEPEQGFSLVPKVIPIGPLPANNRFGNLAGNFWTEDPTCLEWLDQHPPGSVIYVAFGSFTVFDRTQFHELALGLELSNRPFLWVVRPDIVNEEHDIYPNGFQERVSGRGKMIGWAPQGAVLSHPSIACFLSHCGWNSTVEGISNGVPFLCWPYFADQFINESYISDFWKIGLRFKKDEKGIIIKEEIKTKVNQLLKDKDFKDRALKLKEMVDKSTNEGGSSNEMLNKFIEWMKS